MSRRSARPTRDDLLYEAVSEGRRYPGMEHWLPLFHDKLDTLFDYLPGAPVVLEPLAEDAARERLAQIADYYEARKDALARRQRRALQAAAAGPALSAARTNGASGSSTAALARLTPFAVPDESGAVVDVGARQGHNFAAERAEPSANVFDAVTKHVQALQARGKRVVIALWSEGARERMSHVLADHGLPTSPTVAIVAGGAGAAEAAGRARGARARIRLRDRRRRRHQRAGHSGRPAGAAAPRARSAPRISSPRRRASRPAISSCMSITASAASSGLQTIEAAGAPHDCLEIHYADGDKLYPAGREHRAAVALRLGGHRRRARPARRRRLADAQGADEEPHPRDRGRADQDRGRAAVARGAEAHGRAPALYDEFCAGFPYEETEDQQTAIDATLDDLASGRPMDRLVCGDVGFGKTEVALRAAFVAAMSGKQVAVVVPTTLLARQHSKTFTERFHGFPVQDRAGVAAGVRGRTADRVKTGSPTARSTSSSAPMRCSARRSSSRTSAS